LGIEEQVEAFKIAFRTAGLAKRAEGEKAYLKSQLDFHGVTIPFIRSTAKRFRREHPDFTRNELIALATSLWRTGFHDLHSLAIALLELYAERLELKDMAFLENLLRRSHTWDHVDWLSIRVVGALVERYPAAMRTLKRWSKDKNFWIRRASMLALHDPLRAGRGDFDLFARFASGMIEEKEFFIRKAIGWVLREVSKKRPEPVYRFLSKQIGQVSGLTLREGSKYLPKARREDLLRRYRVAASTHGRREKPVC
jgi:3-methyladenine DNA glycosylase AlkD